MVSTPFAAARRHPVILTVLAVLVLSVAVWSSKLAGVYLGVDRAQDYWSSPRGPDGGLLYVALGDSAAQMVGASRPERGYVGLLADRLRVETGEPVQVINLSVSGAGIGDLLDNQLPTRWRSSRIW